MKQFFLRTCIATICIMSSMIANAWDTETDFGVKQNTTTFGPDTEYLQFWACYYNDWGYDSYIPSSDYFVIWYDHEEICSTRELSGENNYKKNSSSTNVYDKTVSTTKNGNIRVVIYKNKSGHSSNGDEKWAEVRIYPSNVQWNTSHEVQFGANYKINQDKVKNFQKVFSFSASVPPMSESNTTMTSPRKGYQKFKNKFADTSKDQEVTLYKKDRTTKVNGKDVSWGWASYSSNSSDYYGRKTSGGNAANQAVEIEFKANDYEPVKVYPRNRISGVTAKCHDYIESVYTVHYPRATGLQVTSDFWNKTVMLKWDKEWSSEGSASLSKDGKWMITRHKAGEKPEYVKHVDFDKLEYTIPASFDTEYDTEYTYTVSFVPNSWGSNYSGATSDLLSEDLSTSKVWEMKRNFAYNNISCVQKGEKIQVAWTCTSIALKNQTEFTVYRITNDGTAKSIGTVSTQKDCGEYSFQENIENLVDKYKYYVKADLLDQTFTSPTAEAVLEGYSHITNLSATKGAYNDNVTLIWDADQLDANNTYFKIERRVHSNFSEDNTQWKLLANMQGQDDQYTYVDTKAQNGIFYDYRVTSYCKNSQKEVRCEKYLTDLGFCSQTGTISGKISYDGGTAVDSVRVFLERIADNGETFSKEASLNCGYNYNGMQWKPDGNMFKSQFGKGAYTMQMYLYPDSAMQVNNHNIMGFGEAAFKLGNYDAAKDEFKLMYGKNDEISGNITYQRHSIIKGRTIDCLEMSSTSKKAHNFNSNNCTVNSEFFYTSYKSGSNATFDLYNTSGKTNNVGIAVKLSSNEMSYVVNVDVDEERIGTYTLTSTPQECVEGYRYYRLYDIPESLLVDSDGNPKSKLAIKLTSEKDTSGGNVYEVRLVNTESNSFIGIEVPGITIPNKKYSHLTFALEKGTMNVTRINRVQDGLVETDSIQTTSFADNCFDNELKVPMVHVGNKFRGFIDDVRLFRRALSKSEILRDFNHYLSGKEKDLVAYWPFDDGIQGTGYAYDHSFTSGDANNNHAIVTAGCELNGIIPTSAELSFSAVTDANGDYIIQGVPYFEGGTNYNVRPMLGIHDFNPATKTCYFSDNSLVFNGNDFTDKSSFPVNGVVFYENTNHPVEGLTVYIDENVAVRDGEVITTTKDGTFEVNVPIGNHYIQLKKNNHDLLNKGRWPATGTHLFDREVRDLTFTDQTLVTVAGRIDGGAIEYDKPLGMGASENNIGQAVITLTSEYYMNAGKETTGLSSIFVPGKTEREFASPTIMVESTAKTGKVTEAGVKTITITTDPKTGEFAVKLPPVNYEIKSITVPSNPDLVFEGVQFPVTLSATNVDLVYTDSLKDESDSWNYFDYKTKYKLAYRTKPVISFNQKGNPEGAYGEPTYDYKYIAEDGAEPVDKQFPLFSYDEETKQTKYVFYDAPVFYQRGRYSFNVEGYEPYVNHDGGKNKEFKVPLDNVTVTVSNEMSAENFIKYDTGELAEIVDGTFKLDSLGKGTYQFIAGFPRTQAPYTLSMSMSFKAGDVDYSWDAPGFADNRFKGIILGQLPYGNNFVTAGTDKLLMVLRDPPGSHSTMSWNEGTSTTKTDNYDNVHYFEEHAEGKHGIETETTLGTGQMSPTGTLALVISTKSTTYAGGSLALSMKEEWANHHQHSQKFSTSTTISTSSDPMYDGPDADLYIGVSRNYLFGTAKKVGLRHQADDSMTLGAEDILTMGDSLSTTFSYTKYYIENTLIPNYRMMRDRMILPMGTSVTNNEKYYMYVSDVPDGDPNFGRPGFYHTVGGVVEKDKALLDSVSWCNSQIAVWEDNIRSNEKSKVKVIQENDEKNKKNYSLSSGTTFTLSNTQSNAGNEGYNFNITHSEDVTIDFETAPFGFSLKNSIGAKHQSNYSWSNSVVNDTIKSFTYTLADGDPEDALSIDVYDAPDGFSPIFYTRAGQTSGNWEPQRLAEYFEPEKKHEIMAQTMKNMVPKLYANSNSQITNVPITGKALFKVTLCNESETNVGGLFKLGMYQNPAGCEVRCNGVPLSSGALSYYLGGQYGQADVTIEISAVDKSILECDLGLRLTDATQSDPLGPYPRNGYELPFKVTFVPASSEIALEADKAILNGNGDGKVSLTLKDYDLNLDNLMNISLEYRGESDSNWKTYNAWSCNPSDKSSETVLDKSSVTVTVDMTDTKTFPDQRYFFRARSTSNFGGEKVYNYSEEVSMLKDIEAPRLVGNPSPSDGTYKYNTEVYATFNEDIRSELITKLDNISLIAQLNDGKISHEVSLQCNGEAYSTEAKMPMPNTTFAINTWVKWNGGTGSIFAHGTTNTNLAIGTASPENNYNFFMKVGEDIYISDKQLPKDEWVFLSAVYDATDEDNRKIICDYASANSNGPVSLIAADHVTPVTFTAAKITMGYNFNGNIHDLSIWNNARSFAEANSQKDKRISKFAPNLAAYWPLNNGHGSVANELLHEANLVLEGDNCWHLENENYSLRLKSEDRVRIVPSANASTNDTEDYMLQLWMRADAETSGSGDDDYATVLSIDNDKTALMLNKTTGALAMRCVNGTMATVSSKDMRDGRWHHFTMMAHKSTNANATLYLDGNNVGHIAANLVSNIVGPIYIGSGFSGNVDELRVVKGMFSESTIKESMYIRYDTGNSRMLLYYPFEVTEADEYGQPATTFSPVDRGVYGEGENRMVAAYDGRVFDELSHSATIAPPLLSTPIMQNVKYDLVVSDRRVSIIITESPERIEGCTLVASLRNIQDKAGNVIEPVTWLFNVNHDFIDWKEKVINENISIAEDMTAGVAIEKHIRNNTGYEKEWSLESVPYWMIPSQTGGVLQPNEELAITFNVLPSIGKGLHTGVIYLVEGATGISHAINYELINHRDIPEWKVVKENYSNTMNIIGQVSNNGMKLEGIYNMVGAFNATNECIGVAIPTYEPRYDAYYYYLTIYGNEASESPMRFAYYDSQTGIVYPDVDILMPVANTDGDAVVKFSPNSIIGSHYDPLLWQANSKIEQTINVNAGWNWISFNTVGSTPLEDLFGEMTANHDEELPVCTEIVNEEAFAHYSAEDGWDGTVTEVHPGTMYKVKMGMPNKITRIGEPANDKRLAHTILPGWNWLGATVSNSISLTSAMADMNPAEGDMIKNYETMSYYTGGGWVGPLKSIVPGVGYYYSSADNTAKEFVYPTKAAVTPYAAKSLAMKQKAGENGQTNLNAAEPKTVSITDYPAKRKYTGTMTMVASIRNNDIIVGNAELQAYDENGELRGINITQDTDDRHLVYIVLHGDNASGLTFNVVVGEGSEAKTFNCTNTVDFEDGNSIGTARSPYIFELSEATAIREIRGNATDAPLYDITGRRVVNTKAHGIYIKNNRKIAK